jgi:hypothetical protein
MPAISAACSTETLAGHHRHGGSELTVRRPRISPTRAPEKYASRTKLHHGKSLCALTTMIGLWQQFHESRPNRLDLIVVRIAALSGARAGKSDDRNYGRG